MSTVNAIRSPSATVATSSSNTPYSGTSNYRMESFKPFPGAKASPSPVADGRQVIRIHFEELSIFLANHMAKEPAGARTNAREKLTRLTRQQFQELSTDVYDELIRRKNNTAKNEVPFLPVRDDFHPKRNQARQKLATLPKSRFKDLSSDVFVELGRRYPELKEDENPAMLSTPGSTYDNPSSPDPLNSPPAAPRPYQPSTVSNIVPEDASFSPYSQPQAARSRPSVDTANDTQSLPYRSTPDLPQGSLGYRQETSPEPVPSAQRKPSGESIASLPYNRRPSQSPEAMAAYPLNRRKPSQDVNNANASMTSLNPSASRRKGSNESSAFSSSQGPSSVTPGVIIPNKSTIAEELIEVPFGREEDSLLSSRPGSPEGGVDPNTRASIQSGSAHTAGRGSGRSARSSPDSLRLSTKSPLDRLGGQAQQSFGEAVGGLSALGQGLLVSSRSEDEGAMSERRAGSDYYDKMSFGRASVASDVSGRGGRVRQSLEDAEKLRSDYEFKIATMQTRMASLEGAVADATKNRVEDAERIRQLEDELASVTESSAKQISEVSRLQQALESQEQDARQTDADVRRITELQERVVVLESELESSGATPDMEALRDQSQALVDTLREMSARTEEMMADKDADMLLIQTLNEQIKEYKRKYEQAKTELRNIKATSQLFSGPQVPKVDARKIPISENGVIADIHVTAFQGAIDTLLSLARSDNPSNVLMSMKAVVNAVAAITDDVKTFERRPTRFDVNEDAVRHLQERADATLSNLVSAARNHAASFGLSPVSLMDAAASHVSATIIDMVKLLFLRRAFLNERDFTKSPTNLSSSSPAPFIPNLELIKSGMQHGRTSSSASSRLRNQDLSQRHYSEQSDRSISPPFQHIVDGNGVTLIGGDDSANESVTMDGIDDAWEELKPYLEVQSESIVYSIQSLLAAIRKGSQMNELKENLAQIITIASSIVAVCKESIPPSSAQQGAEILHDLSRHCDQLSETQSLTEITKQTRQTMASASFGVAKAMKELMKL